MSKVPTNVPPSTHSKTTDKTDKADKKTEDGYKNLEGKKASYPKGNLPRLSERQEKLKNQKASSFTKTRTIRKKKHRSGVLDNDEDELNRNNNNVPTDEEKKIVKDDNLSGGGFSRHDNKKFEDIDDDDDLDELDDLGETGQQSDQRQKNKENVQEFFRKFLEASFIEHTQKKQLEKILFSMLKQCVAGLEVFAEDDPRHLSLGRSANICKHALSALAHDNFIEAKKLVRLITPKK